MEKIKPLETIAMQRLTGDDWKSIFSPFKTFSEILNVDEKVVEGYMIVNMRTEWLYKFSFIINFAITFDMDSKLVAGFRYVPEYTYPDYVDPNKFKEIDINGIGPKNLPGTLSIPHDNKLEGVVILVPGSGPTDRNETLEGNKDFVDIAGALASNNIAVLRFDKRTRWMKVENITFVEEYLEDSVSACAMMTDRFKMPCVIIGHSLGGKMAPLILQESGFNAVGLIGLAAAVEKTLITLKRQLNYIWTLDNKTLTPEEKKCLDDIDDVENLLERNKLPDDYVMPECISNLPAHYLKTFYEYDPIAVAEEQKKKMIFLNGKKDYQVTIEDDFVNWENMKSKYKETKAYDNLNHLFMYVEGQQSRPEDYMTPSHVQPEVINDLVKFVKSFYD